MRICRKGRAASNLNQHLTLVRPCSWPSDVGGTAFRIHNLSDPQPERPTQKNSRTGFAILDRLHQSPHCVARWALGERLPETAGLRRSRGVQGQNSMQGQSRMQRQSRMQQGKAAGIRGKAACRGKAPAVYLAQPEGLGIRSPESI